MLLLFFSTQWVVILDFIGVQIYSQYHRNRDTRSTKLYFSPLFFFVLEIENNCDIFWKLKKIATELSTTKAVLCVWYFDAELSTTKAVLCVWYFDAENRHTSSAALQQRNTAIYWEHRHRIVASK